MRRSRGFTLLELLIVVFILSLVAFSAAITLGDREDGIRYEETVGRLRQIEAAIVGTEATLEAMGPSGYVADLGGLPASIEHLVRNPDLDLNAAPDLPAFSSRAPGDLFGSGYELNASRHHLPKGWRGPYLRTPPSTTPEATRFRDGWGTVSRPPTSDALHHGWIPFDPSTTPFLIGSRGSDGIPGDSGENSFDGDLVREIPATAWRVDLSGWAISVENASGGTVEFSASLLVYSDHDSDGTWTWVRHDSEHQSIADGSSNQLAFPTQTSVPIGRHLLVLLSGSEGNETPYGASPFMTKQITLLARRLPPIVAWLAE